MAPDNNNAASSKPLAEETTATKKRHKRTTTSTETLAPPSTSNPPPPLPTLPFELVEEILFSLPVKPLSRFRCVCKSWNSLISNPKFAKKHLRRSRKDLSRHRLIVTCITDDPLHEFILEDYPLQSLYNAAVTTPATLLKYPYRFHSIDGSCDGILCLNIDHRNTAVLWNPSTQRFKKLPSLKYPQLPLGRCCYTTFSFGYDQLSDSYKVVAVFRFQCDDRYYKTRVKVYTLGTDSSWRRIQKLPLGVDTYISGKFVSGTLNWLSSVDSVSSWVVVSLDLGKESYQELMQPVNRKGEEYWTFEVNLILGVLRDCLCIIANHDTWPDKFSDVWLMKEYGNAKSWTKLFRIGKLCILYPNVLHMSEDEEVLLELECDLVLFNANTFKTTKIRNIDTAVHVPEVCVESLISPCSLY